MKTGAIRIVLVAGLALSVFVQAKDLGVRGASWPVVEADLLESIAARLTEMEDSGELARLERDARERARRSLEEPEAMAGILPATVARTRSFDPSIRVEREIVGPGGELIARAGARINPFELAPDISAEMLFIDGRRAAEVEWALAGNPNAKIILLAGRPLDLMRRHGRPVYFDIGGRLSARFALRFTPTRLSRDGDSLLLEEVPVADSPEDFLPGFDEEPCAKTNTPETERSQKPC